MPHDDRDTLDDENRERASWYHAATWKQWIERNRGPPIVVHCSAGVGRTGTLCALDVIAERLWKTRDRPGGPLVSIGQTVKIMRTQRHKAVQRPEQYLFLYLRVVEYALKNHLVDPEKVDVSAFMTKK